MSLDLALDSCVAHSPCMQHIYISWSRLDTDTSLLLRYIKNDSMAKMTIASKLWY